jgi:hypothetical protein
MSNEPSNEPEKQLESSETDEEEETPTAWYVTVATARAE